MMIGPVTLAAGFVAATLGVLLLTPLAMRLAHRFGFYDIPNGRKVHTAPIPLLGGMAVFVAVFAVLLAVGAAAGVSLTGNRIGFLVGGVIIFLLGLLDDRYGLSVRVKLFGQIVAACCLVLSGNTDGLIGSSPVALVLCLLWTVGMMNATNFLDGLDGLAAGTSFLAGLAFSVVALVGGQPYPALVASIVAGAALGFLRWNWNPARIFLGDAGSLFFGYMLAALGLMCTWDQSSLAYLVVPVIVLGVPIFDISFVVAIRLLEGRAISTPGKDHTSHRILATLRSVRRSTLLFLGVSLGLGAAAILLALVSSPTLFLLGAGSLVLLSVAAGHRLSKVVPS